MANPVKDIGPYQHLVRYAALAYHNGDGRQFRSWVPRTELNGTPLKDRKVQLNTWTTHSHAHLGIRNGDTLVIAFRGTDFPMTWENWQKSARWVGLGVNLLTDVSYHLVHPNWIPHSRALVHEGFLRDFEGLREDLVKSIDRLFTHRSPQKIETCGHSLGGALATLCALWCHRNWPDVPITCLTLASPRVGNTHFASFFGTCSKITCYRLVIPSDLIPTIPNEATERCPLRLSLNAPFWLKYRRHGDTWAHVGPALQLQLPNLADDESWWVRVWKKVSLAAHLPSGYVETVQRMLDVLKDQLALSWAAINGHEDIVRLLLRNGAELEAKSNMGRTPLSLAAMNGHEGIVRLLLGNGAELEAKSNMGWTPLLLAVVNGHEGIVRLLLENGAELEAKSNMGWTPLSLAVMSGRDGIVHLLLEKGAELKAKDNDRWTPLSWDVINGNEGIIRLLLENGAELKAKSNMDKTPLLQCFK